MRQGEGYACMDDSYENAVTACFHVGGAGHACMDDLVVEYVPAHRKPPEVSIASSLPGMACRGSPGNINGSRCMAGASMAHQRKTFSDVRHLKCPTDFQQPRLRLHTLG
jgi:hypothetical protein